MLTTFFLTAIAAITGTKIITILKVQAKGGFLVTDNRVFNGPLGRSLRLFVRSHRSLRSLVPQHSALLRSLAPFMGSLTHFAHSFMGQLEFTNMCST